LREKDYALLGLIAPTTAIVSIAAAILSSPWFRWENNALSDLGHSVHSAAAPIFNFGLLLTGFLIIVFAVASFRNHAKYTSCLLTLTGFSLQLVATFDEVYGTIHFVVSILFFAALGLASISYAIEKKSTLAAAAFIIGMLSWILYGIEAYSAGIAVPETISSMAVVTWVASASIKMYQGKTKSEA